jgi:tetratricopeptide (TPR) repeat protein
MGLKGLPTIWTRPTWYADGGYRPLAATLFAINQAAFGTHALAGHIEISVLYALSVSLLFLLLNRLLRERHTHLALAAALLFAAHPVHTEVVANVKSMDEALCFLNCIGMMLFILKFIDTRKSRHIVAALACFSLALLSKETAISFIVVVPLMLFFFTSLEKRRIIRLVLPFFILGFAYLLLSYLAIGSIKGYAADSIINNSLLAIHSPMQRLGTAVFILFKYLGLLIIPYPLVHDRSYNQIVAMKISDIGFWAAFIINAALLVMGLLFAKGKSIWSFGILYFYITIALVSNIFFLIGATMAERFLYIPSLGFCLIAASAIEMAVRKFGWNGKIHATIVAGVLVLYSGMTITRNADWRDNLSLFSRDIKYSPNSASLNASLGNMLIITAQNSSDANARAQMLLQAKQVLQRAIAIYPAYFYALGNLALTYEFLGDEDSALITFKRSIALNTNDGVALVNVGDIFFHKKEYDSALVYYEKLLILNAVNPDARFRLANTQTLAGWYDEAIGNFRKVMKENPEYPRIKEFLGYAEELKKTAERYAPPKAPMEGIPHAK